MYIKNETGRSMLEMLAVLAIVGILSVLSFLSFRYLINKNKANTILYDVSLAFNELLSKEKVGTLDTTQLSFLPESSLEFQVSQDEFSNHFVHVKGVSQKVCEILLKNEQIRNTYNIYQYQTTTRMVDCNNMQGMTFGLESLKEKVEGVSCQSDNDCAFFCQTCQNGVCQGGCDSQKKEQCYKGNCVITECTEDGGCEEGSCRALSDPANNHCRDNECIKDEDCKDETKPYCNLSSAQAKCVECRFDEDCVSGFCHDDGSCKEPSPGCSTGAWYHSSLNCTCEGYTWNGIACCPVEDETLIHQLSANQCALCGYKVIDGVCTKLDCAFPQNSTECEACGGQWLENECIFETCQDNSMCSLNEYCGGATGNYEAVYTGCFPVQYTEGKIYYNGSWETWARFENNMSYWDALMACDAIQGNVPAMSDITHERWKLLGRLGWQDWVWTSHSWGGAMQDLAGLMNGGVYNAGRGEKHVTICRTK